MDRTNETKLSYEELLEINKSLREENESLKLENKENIKSLKKMISDLKVQIELATRDNLTGLYGRSAIKTYFDKQLSSKNSEKIDSMHIIAIDLDFFKSINDTYGHEVGDEALINVANGLNRFFRKKDLVVRYGGDEFLVVVKNCSLSILNYKIEQMSEYITDSIDRDLDERFKDIPRAHDYTLSCGVSEMDLSKFNSELLSNEENFNNWFNTEFTKADEALYMVKDARHALRK